MTTPSPISIVLVGCGAVSQQFYLPTLQTLVGRGEVIVSAIVDPNESARSSLASAFSSAQSVANLAQVKAADGSLAIIATPPRFHAAQTLESFDRGWHVLCEKPMASTVAECEAMIQRGQAANRLLAVGLYKRFFPSSAYLKQLFDQGHLGKLRGFSISEGGPFRWPAASPSFFQKTQTPGGVLLDVGVHVLDLLLWWLGEPVSYRYFDDAMGGLETNVRLELDFPNSARGVVHLSRDWDTRNRYRFEFERGTVTWKVNDANGLTVQLAGAPAGLRAQLVSPIQLQEDIHPQILPSNPQSFILQLRNVCAALRGEEKLLIDGSEGAKSFRLIEGCYNRRELIEQPWLTAQESARAQELASAP